jgi:hypothetical protein
MTPPDRIELLERSLRRTRIAVAIVSAIASLALGLSLHRAYFTSELRFSKGGHTTVINGYGIHVSSRSGDFAALGNVRGSTPRLVLFADRKIGHAAAEISLLTGDDVALPRIHLIGHDEMFGETSMMITPDKGIGRTPDAPR